MRHLAAGDAPAHARPQRRIQQLEDALALGAAWIMIVVPPIVALVGLGLLVTVGVAAVPPALLLLLGVIAVELTLGALTRNLASRARERGARAALHALRLRPPAAAPSEHPHAA